MDINDSLPSWATVGNKVICINNEPHFVHNTAGANLHGLEKNKIYTIREAYFDEVIWHEFHLKLMEIKRPIYYVSTYYPNHEIGYSIKRFRPLIKKSLEDDLEIFRKIDISILETA